MKSYEEIEEAIKPLIEPLGYLAYWAAHLEHELRVTLAVMTLDIALLRSVHEAYDGKVMLTREGLQAISEYSDGVAKLDKDVSHLKPEKFVYAFRRNPLLCADLELLSDLKKHLADCVQLKARRNRLFHDKLDIDFDFSEMSDDGVMPIYTQRSGVVRGRSKVHRARIDQDEIQGLVMRLYSETAVADRIQDRICRHLGVDPDYMRFLG